MKQLLFFFLLTAYSSFSQGSFNLKVSGKGLDTVVVSPPACKSSLHHLYNIKFTSGDYLFDVDGKAVFTRITKPIKLNGEIPQPHPLAITIAGEENNGYEGNYFFVEKGNIEISVKDNLGNADIINTSPSDIEYAKIKAITKVCDDLLKGEDKVDLTVLDSKQKILKNYIVQNPGSFVALWEIFFDYSNYDYHPQYLENLNLFSEKVKGSDLHIGLGKVLEGHKSSLVGKILPAVFLKDFTLNKEYFSNHKLTVIDYWATSCKPCIEGFPRLKEIHEKFIDKGLNLIGIIDENETERMNRARSILESKGVNWANYFDTYDELPQKLSVSGYPTFFVVDSTGKILQRFTGEYDKLELEIKRSLGD